MLAWIAFEKELPYLVEWLVRDSMLMSPKGKKHFTHDIFTFIFSREVTEEKEQNDEADELMRMKQEYERYKNLWGLNLQYSHSAGPSQNYSELTFDIISRFLFFPQPRKRS